MLEKIIKKIEEIENINDQSVSFVLHGDGSGSFEDFWNSDAIVMFDNLEELDQVLSNSFAAAE